MRQSQIQELILNSAAAHQPKINISNSKAKGIAHYLTETGVEDSDIIHKIVPAIIDQLALTPAVTNKFPHAAFLDQFIRDNHIAVPPEPLRTSKSAVKAQRRVDSLSRLMAVPDTISPCVAVVLHEGKFVIASNFPRIAGTDEAETISKFTKLMVRRLQIVQDFIKKMEADFLAGSKFEASEDIDMFLTDDESLAAEELKIAFNAKGLALAALAVRALGKDDAGGYATVVPERNKKCESQREHLQKALLKLASSYFLAKYYGKTDTGLSVEQANALTSGNYEVLVRSDSIGKGNWHAEQLIVDYLRQNNSINPEEPVHIGISKLCCQACDSVLSEFKGIEYRGSHGVSFPGVHNMLTGEVHQGLRTGKSTHLCASDSDSEVDLSSSNSSLTSSMDLPSSSSQITADSESGIGSLKRSVDSMYGCGQTFFMVKKAREAHRLTASCDEITVPIKV
ncbi:nucleic acid/nucleotide deaminase domain-containing protein [Legionella sp. 16cNR16C]|uniref:nucleic acid/nucleotide deaminase domain-containing protein n=1 Tax=Legionella sp. 16cNR16C TaxID=2905656 RepID=UPI001E2C53DF|nr:nucleic acid/nucleotide deaminase domain-containing protein [Legionella sp. 16cNR16C]MCE3044048.1 nucleic acid/nucleotide deaminase domain-containing protein [Legionella sp. 16cNR16C]